MDPGLLMTAGPEPPQARPPPSQLKDGPVLVFHTRPGLLSPGQQRAPIKTSPAFFQREPRRGTEAVIRLKLAQRRARDKGNRASKI